MSVSRPDAAPIRVVIIGNSGSGKSTLAKGLASQHELAHLDLDSLAWEPTQPPERKPLREAARSIQDFTAQHEQWVVEGCYADLVELLLPGASELIFLDLDVEKCQRNARLRPWEPHKYPSKQAQDANLDMLLGWIADYPGRQGVLGRNAHQALFDNFHGNKQRRTA